MEQAANVAEDNLDALSQIRSHWLARLAHDFRGPLFAARGYTKMMLDDAGEPVTDTHRRYLENIAESLNKIALLVNAINDFPTSEALNLEELDLGPVLRRAADEHRGRVPHLQFEASIPDESFITTADRAKLVEAVHKLLAAAVEFAGPDGETRLHTRQEDGEMTIRFSAARKNPAPASPATNLAIPCDILRLHGGVAHVDGGRDGVFHVTIRLPLVAVANRVAKGKKHA